MILSRRNEKLYRVYYGMKQRCYNHKNPKYDIYGGHGVTICDKWLEDYDAFKTWSLQNGYLEGRGLSIDRIDSDKGYCPENCQWISLSLNSAKANMGRQKNKSKGGKMFAVSPEGETILITNVSKFCRENDLDRCLVSHRLNGIINNPYLYGWKIYRE